MAIPLNKTGKVWASESFLAFNIYEYIPQRSLLEVEISIHNFKDKKSNDWDGFPDELFNADTNFNAAFH